MDIIYQHLTQQQIGPELFSGFDRWQNVTRCWRKENGSWVLRDIAFIDDWNEEEYIFLYDCLKNTLNTGGDVIAALEGNRLLGFASVENQPFGPQNEYLQLSSLHVSNGMRGRGIGSHLFAMSCLAAAQRGAKELYLSGHSAEETQAFYRAMGCVEAAWYHPELVAAEPCDCQLERQLCGVLPFPGEDFATAPTSLKQPKSFCGRSAAPNRSFPNSSGCRRNGRRKAPSMATTKMSRTTSKVTASLPPFAGSR